MIDTIRGVFESECGHLKFDKKLAKAISDFQIGFVSKNEEHLQFFGGHLTGVHVVRFTQADRDSWFNIFDINDLSLEEKLLDLPSINPNFIVSSDAFNHTCTWVIHKFMNSPLLNDDDKQEAMINVALVLHYRFLTSLLQHTFRYPADEQVAEATYARLSNKFLLKQYGSWSATLVGRCTDLISKDSIHRKIFENYSPDSAVVYLINDTQGRIRDLFKNIVEEFLKTNRLGIKISTTSATIEHDGESILKDKTKNLSAYTRYLHSIVTDRNSFIKEELVSIVANVMHTMPPKLLIQCLEWCSNNYNHTPHKDVEQLVDHAMTHSFGYLADNRTLLKQTNDLPGLISKLRGIYMSSRSQDPDLVILRDLSQKVVKQATKTKNDSVIASLKTGLLIYIVLRGFTMHHYTH